MRKITKQAIDAFMNAQPFKMSNTKVIVHDYATDGTITQLFLHDNLIAESSETDLRITNAGWQSNTTKERLNGIPGVRISQKKGKWYLNNVEWDGRWIKVKA